MSKWTQVPGFNVAFSNSTVRHRIESLNVRNAKNASTLHAQTLVTTNSWEMNPGPRFQCGLFKQYCKTSDRVLECEECEKRFHASCSNFGDDELLRIDSGDGAWYCTNCKADCGLCSGAALKGHKAVQCDSCDMWIHNECSFIAETQSWIFLSFLSTLCGQVSGKGSEVAIELSILFFWIATTCGWWKSRKASNSVFFFASYAIEIHANEFQPTNKAAFICTTRWRLIFLLFC